MATRYLSLLFRNRSQTQTLLKNSFWLGIADGATRLTKFLLTLYVIRTFGRLEYGKFAFAFAFVALFSTFFDFGLTPIVTREFSRDREEERSFPAVLTLKLVLGFFVLIFMVVVGFLVTSDGIVRKLILILAVTLWVSEVSATYYAFFRSRQKMEYESCLGLLGCVTLGIGGGALLAASTSIVAFGYAYLLGAVAVLAATSALAVAKDVPISLKVDRATWRRYASRSAPLALFGIASAVYMCGDSVILGLLGQIEETGLYNAALRITGLTIVPMNLALPVFFPMLSAAPQKQSADFQPLFDRQVAILIFAAFLTTCLVLPLASPIIEVAFTQRFADAATALRIAIFVSFFQYLWAAYNQVLIVFNQQKRVFVAHVAGAVFNVVLNMFLIPWLSYFGAALASVLTQLLLFCLLLVSVSRLTPVAFSRRLLLSAVIPGMLAGLTVCGTLLLMSGSGAIFLVFAAVAGSVGYSLCFFGIRGLLMSTWVAEVFGDLLTQRGSCGVVDARKR